MKYFMCCVEIWEIINHQHLHSETLNFHFVLFLDGKKIFLRNNISFNHLSRNKEQSILTKFI